MENALTTNNTNALTPIDATPLEMRTDAGRFPRLHTIRRDDAIAQMIDIVRAAAIYRGAKIEASEVAAVAAALVDELNADTRFGLRFISFAEIRRAVRTACLETEMYGVNVASLYRAIVAYARGEGQSAREQAATLARNRRPSAPQIAIDAAAGQMITNLKNK